MDSYNRRKVTIVATSQEGIVSTCVINYMVDNDRLPSMDDVKDAIHKAVRDYCRTKEGKEIYEGNRNSFNWGDLIICVPSSILEAHGLYQVEDNPCDVMEVDFDEQLVEESEIFPEDKEDTTPSVKYAVSVYGIRQDNCMDKDGNVGIAGLTFGPASGASYRMEYVSRGHGGTDHSGVTASGNRHRCIHEDDWCTIIEWSRKDPYVYECCLGDKEHPSCTKAVPLVIGNKMRNDDFPDVIGDGASVLYHSIMPDYREWNRTTNKTGGWPASRIRATLNGADTNTDESVAGEGCLTASDSLFAAFPKELQDAIAAKAVKSNITDCDSEGIVTTYDRLWLFSGKEYWNDSDCTEFQSEEEHLYQRQTPVDIGKITCQSTRLYEEYGNARDAWLRTVREYAHNAYIVHSSGVWSYDGVYLRNHGVAPGFCLK